MLWAILTIASALALGACYSVPLFPYDEETPPMVLLPAASAGVEDGRARFREIFCGVLEARGTRLPDHRPCEDALVKVGAESPGRSQQIELGPSRRRLVAALVPGLGWDCVAQWLDLDGSVNLHVRQYDYDLVTIAVDGLASSRNNAARIRDAIHRLQLDEGADRMVLIGYSKGTVDILEALVAYPEIRGGIAAVVSVAGAIGGSPLAADVSQSQLEYLQHWPGAECTGGDGGGIEDLRPATRKAWLAQNPLPPELRYYSLVTYPKPERISSLLASSYKKLSQVDARNDGQLIFYDQVIPGSKLLGYINADHWAAAVPIARAHGFIGSTLADQNDFPREALLEAILRFVEEDLQAGFE